MTILPPTTALMPTSGLSVFASTPQDHTLATWHAEMFRATEGDVSGFPMMAPNLAQLPSQYHPGQSIGLIGVSVSDDQFTEMDRTADGSQAQHITHQLTHTEDGKRTIWLHPDTYHQIADRDPSIRQHSISTGKGIVGSSVRTVLLTHVSDQQITHPLECKTSLDRPVGGRPRTLDATELRRDLHTAGITTSLPLLGGYFSVKAKAEPLTDIDLMIARPQLSDPSTTIGFLLRAWSTDTLTPSSEATHLSVPFFSLFGHPSKNPDHASLLSEIYASIKKRTPESTAHDFVFNFIVKPFLEQIFGLANQGLLMNGTHHQNPKINIKIPLQDIDPDNPWQWLEKANFSLGNIIFKELNPFNDSRIIMPALISTFFRNLWVYTLSANNWGAALPGFNKTEFHKLLFDLLRQYQPDPQQAPPNIIPHQWKIYSHMYNEMMTALSDPTQALKQSLFTARDSNFSHSMDFDYVYGDTIAASAIPGLHTHDWTGFIMSHDRITLLAQANLEKDVQALVARENQLHETVLANLKRKGMDPSSNPKAYKAELAKVLYSPEELNKLKQAIMTHAGLSFVHPDIRTQICDLVFGKDRDSFIDVVNLFASANNKDKHTLEDLPRLSVHLKSLLQSLFIIADNNQINIGPSNPNALQELKSDPTWQQAIINWHKDINTHLRKRATKQARPPHYISPTLPTSIQSFLSSFWKVIDTLTP